MCSKALAMREISVVLGERIDEFGIAASLPVAGADHRHRRQERDSDRTRTIESPGQQNRLPPTSIS